MAILPMTGKEAKVVAAWREAVTRLGIRFSSPFTIALPDGTKHECLGLVHQFGGRVGTVIAAIDEPSESADLRPADDYHWSILGDSYCEFDRQLFADTLNDWKFFGPDCERPEWYSGKDWS